MEERKQQAPTLSTVVVLYFCPITARFRKKLCRIYLQYFCTCVYLLPICFKTGPPSAGLHLVMVAFHCVGSTATIQRGRWLTCRSKKIRPGEFHPFEVASRRGDHMVLI